MEFHITKEHLFFEDTIFLHLSGSNGQIYAHNKMPNVFNLGLITPLHTIVYPCFSLIFKISLIFTNMQRKYFSYRNTGWKNLSNCVIDYIKTGNNGGLKMFMDWNMFIYVFYDFI